MAEDDSKFEIVENRNNEKLLEMEANRNALAELKDIEQKIKFIPSAEQYDLSNLATVFVRLENGTLSPVEALAEARKIIEELKLNQTLEEIAQLTASK